MPTYALTDGQSGASFQVDFDGPPTTDDVDAAVNEYRKSRQPSTPVPQPSTPTSSDPSAAPVEDETPTSTAGTLARSAGTSVAPAFGARFGGAAGAGAATEAVKAARTGVSLGKILAGAWRGARTGALGGEAAGGGPEDPLADILGAGGAVVGAMVGGILADRAQNEALKLAAPKLHDELTQFQQEDLQDHPLAVFAGNLAGSLPAFKLQNPLQTARSASAIIKIARGQAVTEAEKGMAKNLAVQAGLGAGLGVVNPLIQGQKPTIGDVSQSMAQMLLFGSPREFGGKTPPTGGAIPPTTTGEKNAIPIRSPAKTDVGETPADSEEMGGRVSEPEKAAIPQAQEVQPPQTQPQPDVETTPPEVVPINPGGAPSSLPPDLAAQSAANNSRAAFEALAAKTGTKLPSPATTPQTDWRVVVQQPEVKGQKPFVQIVDPKASEQSQSPTMESLKAVGINVPDFTKLPTGRYTYQEAIEKLNQHQPATKPAVSIEYPAVRYRNAAYPVSPGQNHDETISNIRKNMGATNVKKYPPEKGFTTSDGQFITDRVQAADIAKAAGQVPDSVKELHSEDFWAGKTAAQTATPSVPRPVRLAPQTGYDAVHEWARRATPISMKLRRENTPESAALNNQIRNTDFGLRSKIDGLSKEDIDQANAVLSNVTAQFHEALFKEAGYKSEKIFRRDYDKNHLAENDETEDEFIRRRFCSGTVSNRALRSAGE